MSAEPIRTALGPLPAGYHDEYDAIIRAVEPDERIRGLWLAGSLARGVADAGSDLDLVLAVRDDDFDDFVADWRTWLAGITPLLLANAIPHSNLIFFALTGSCCRIDGVVEPVSGTGTSSSRHRLPVLDRDGLTATVPAPAARPGPDAARLTGLAEEFWRQQAIFPAMLDGRRDLLVSVVGAQQAAGLLYDVLVESNQPQPPMGVKQWSARLTREQRTLLESLPVAGVDRTALIATMAAIRRAMAAVGREAVERCGGTWPHRLADTVTAYVESALDERRPGAAVHASSGSRK